jgi:hypothetical protein
MTLSAKWRNRAADGQNPATDSILNIRTIPPQANSANTANYANAIPPPPLSTAGGPSDLPWPEPEPFPLVVRSEPWKYACLFAIASVYGAGLTKDAGGGLTLTCPETMPQGAAQAAQDGFAGLAGYIGGRLQ